MKYDVLILGAGVAGLMAGRFLAQAGVRVAIVEARDRVGGRIATEHVSLMGTSNLLPVELGAEFVHGLPEATWKLIEEARLATYELSGPRLFFEHGRLSVRSDEDRDASIVLEQMNEWLKTQPAGTDCSFADYLAVAGIERSRADAARAYVEGFNAADANVIGVAALAQQQRAEDAIDADRLFHVRDGYDAVPNFLRRQFERAGGSVLTGKRVTRIRWARSSVALSGADRHGTPFEIQSPQAVITLPLGVLQTDSVEFHPTPGDLLRHAGRMATGAVMRVSLVFDSKFWCDQAAADRSQGTPAQSGDFSFLFARTECFPTWWTSMPDPAPLITAWIGGRRALELDLTARLRTDPLAIRGQCVAELARIFQRSPQALEKRLVSWHAHDWQSDEFSRGAYSYAPAAAHDASARMTEPVEGTLFFAGEHTDTEGHWGTVHGALASGARAARQVMGIRSR